MYYDTDDSRLQVYTGTAFDRVQSGDTVLCTDIRDPDTVAGELVLGDSTGGGNSMRFVRQYATYSNATGNAPAYEFRRSGNTAGVASIVGANDFLGVLSFKGYDGSSFQDGGIILCLVDGTPGAGDMPTAMVFGVAPDGSTTLSESMRLPAGGGVQVQQETTANAPTDAPGVIYYDTTLNKLRVGTGSGFETITSV